MNKTLGSIEILEEKIILKYPDGVKEIYEKKGEKNDGKSWIILNGERFFPKEL